MNRHLPVPPEELLRSLGTGEPPASAIARPILDAHVLEDFTPVPLNLEWRLSELMWQQDGVRGFTNGEVPFIANSGGPPSADAAAILFASCLDAAQQAGPIRILEIGAGTGLFARYLLDEFQELCRKESRDFYDRLEFHVTDGSPATVRHWAEIGIFGPHSGHVVASVCDARHPEEVVPGPLRAAFANYVLDSLPVSFVRRTGDAWEVLCARASIGRSTDLAAYTALTPDEVRERAQSDPGGLVPLLPVLECEMRLRPLDEQPWVHRLPLLNEASTVVPCCYGALTALEAIEALLEPDGFISIRDYGCTANEPDAKSQGGDRFGGSTAVGLNFRQITNWAEERRLTVLEPAERDWVTRWRLIARAPGEFTRQRYHSRVSASAVESGNLVSGALERARNGDPVGALDAFRKAIAETPRDWHLIGEAAQFVQNTLRDPATALELARASLEINPWYAPYLWNLAGDCLVALGRAGDAHDCFLHSYSIAAENADTCLRLAGSWLRLNDPVRALYSAAQGLACDRASMLRQDLLAVQSLAIESLAGRWTREREVAFRRSRQSSV